MKRFALLLVLLAAPAFAADEPKKLTVGECVDIYIGLGNLDSYERVVKESGAEKVIRGQYRLGDARMTVALNMGALKPVAEAANKTRQEILLEVGDGKAIAPDDQKAVAKATAMFEAALKEPCPVTPGRIKLSDLKIGDSPEQNQIPPSVLSAIMPIVDR
jgi:hypothetical protein